MYKNEEEEIREVVRREVHKELANIEAEISHNAGSYNWMLSCNGVTFFAHRPVLGAQVIRPISHFD